MPTTQTKPLTFRVYIQVLENSYEMTPLDYTVDDLQEALTMVENLKAQGFKSYAAVEVK